MMSQIGSLPRVARSALADGRSATTGMIRSAILTYYGRIVMPRQAFRIRILPAAGPSDCAAGASALSWVGRNIPGVAARRKTIGAQGNPCAVMPATARGGAMAEKPYDRLDG